MSKIYSDAERKANEEKKNDLITRAESIVNSAKTEKRELTPDEMQELAEIRDDVKKIKEALGLDDDFRALEDAEAKPDAEPKEEEMKDTERACGEQEKRALEKRELEETKMFEEYIRGSGEPQHRGGKGVKSYNCTEKTGHVADCKVVDEQDDLLIISDDGTIIRMDVAEISVYGRATQGVRLMRVSEGSRVISIARTEKEDAEPKEEDS